MTPEEAAYRQALLVLAHHQEARQLALDSALAAREQLAAVSPDHPLLKMSTTDAANLLRGLNISPLQALYELFVRKDWELSARGVDPATALLAGSLAVSRGADSREVMRRISDIIRPRQLDMAR